MAKQLLNKYEKLNVDPLYGGYSDIRLWPCYMVFSASILFLSPHIGMFASFMLLGVPAFVIAKFVAGKQPVQQYDSYRWMKDVELALKKEIYPLPELKDYEIKPLAKVTTNRTPKIATKELDKSTAPVSRLVFSKT